MECYLELARRNEPVNKAEKVIDFLSWIAASELQRLCIILKKKMEATNFIMLSVKPIKQNA
jgi:hypothetical protein